MKKSLNPSFPRARNGGFALVMAMLVLALLVVTIVGSSIFLQIETRTADNSRQIADARQNALFALEIALGELQQLAGPDQRVTATASLTRNATGTQWEPGNIAADNPHRNWTGVWDCSAPRYIPTAGTPGRVDGNMGTGTGQLHPEPLAWLVSGGKNRLTANGSESQTTNVTPINYPARINNAGVPISVGSAVDHIVLLGNGSVNLAANPEDGIVVPKVAIFTPKGNATSRTGSYAYWVGDEGVKARFDALESAAFASKTDAEKRDYRVLGAQRWGIEAMVASSGNSTETFGGIGYDPSSANFAQKATAVSAWEHIRYLDTDNEFRDAARGRFHDLTIFSEGVLADVKKGGLKQDLTVYLKQGPITGVLADGDLLFSDSRDISTVTDPRNPRAPFRVRYPGFHPTSNDGLPRFGLLRSWYQMDAANPTITPRTSTDHGLYPVIVRCEWPIWVDVNLNLTGVTYPHTLPAGALTPRVHPTITLWNPYNVDLPAQEYLVEINVGPNAIFGFITDGTQTISGPTSVAPYRYEIPQSIRLRIPPPEGAIPAGQTKVYTLEQNHPNGSSSMDLISAYFPIAPLTEWWRSGLNQPPKAINSNFSFGLGNPTGPQLIINSAPPNNVQRTLVGVVARHTSTSSANRRVVNLYNGVAGNLLQTLTPAPENYMWLSSGSDTNWVQSTAPIFINFSGDNTFSFDTRKPQLSWQARPVSHYVSGSNSSLWTGGSFTSMIDFDYRVATAGTPPLVAIGGREALRWGGPYRFFPDGSTSDVVGVNQNLFSFGGSPASERFFYAYIDTRFRNAENNTSDLVSAAFNSAASLGNNTPLFDLKPSGRELVCLGYLQHVNLASYIWQPSYPFGNSWVNPQMAGRDRYSGFFSGAPAPATDTANRVYDLPYLANESLWDRFFLGGAEAGAVGAGFLNNSQNLPNSRLVFRQSLNATYDTSTNANDRFNLGARFLSLDGAFNINSTSVAAWKAFLSSRNGLRINAVTAGPGEAVFTRILEPGGGSGGFLTTPAAGQPAAETAAAYTGARKLSANEVQTLAEKVVEQVQLRGPFTSLSDFINRRLPPEPASSAAETAFTRTGFMGTLQAAIDAASDSFIAAGSSGVNAMFYNSTLPGSFFQVGKIPARPITTPYNRITSVDDVPLASLVGFYVPRLRMLGRPWYYSAAGVPGFLTQADILSGLGHLMAARSDTFTIRAYGENLSPSGQIVAKAWCEAVVQRVPEPVKSNPTNAEILWPENPSNVASDPLNALGRKFIIKSFRWLTPEEV